MLIFYDHFHLIFCCLHRCKMHGNRLRIIVVVCHLIYINQRYDVKRNILFFFILVYFLNASLFCILFLSAIDSLVSSSNDHTGCCYTTLAHLFYFIFTYFRLDLSFSVLFSLIHLQLVFMSLCFLCSFVIAQYI